MLEAGAPQLLADLGTTWRQLAVVVVSGVAVYVVVIALSRLAGLRSLAKMSTFDFAATVAVGSTVASTVLGTSPLSVGVLALALLFGLQYLVATLRRRNLLGGVVDNPPILLMAGPRVLEGNLRHARVSRAELWSQLRLAGVRQLADVQAVVMETTGDISVLTTDRPLDAVLLEGVRGAEELR